MQLFGQLHFTSCVYRTICFLIRPSEVAMKRAVLRRKVDRPLKACDRGARFSLAKLQFSQNVVGFSALRV